MEKASIYSVDTVECLPHHIWALQHAGYQIAVVQQGCRDWGLNNRMASDRVWFQHAKDWVLPGCAGAQRAVVGAGRRTPPSMSTARGRRRPSGITSGSAASNSARRTECCVARVSVGAIRAPCCPEPTDASSARNATAVFPEPTSPYHTSTCHRGCC